MGQDLEGGGSYNDPPPPVLDSSPGEGPHPGEWRTPPLWGVADSAPIGDHRAMPDRTRPDSRPDPDRATIAEAAARLGLSTDAVRRALVETLLHGGRVELVRTLDETLLGLRPRPATHVAA